MLIGEGDSAELRDLKLGQVVRLGAVAGCVVGLLDGTRDAEQLLRDAGRALGDEINPLGLVELLQALDRRALLDTPRARMVVAEGAVRADIAALQRLSQRLRPLQAYSGGTPGQHAGGPVEPEVGPGAAFACRSCARCCSDQQMLGPIPRAERDAILAGFAKIGLVKESEPSNFVPLPTGETPPVYLLRARQGYCVYLATDGGCRVQNELGEELKPSHCRMYPFRAVKTPMGWDVGLSLSCPTVASGLGPSAQGEVSRTLKSLPVVHPALHQIPDVVPATPDRLLPYSVYRGWERETLAAISDPSADPGQVWLRGVERFLDLAGQADPDETELGTGDLELADDDVVEDETVSRVHYSTASLDDADPPTNVDGALADLALWMELLTGLEPADPSALRRFRHALLRLRAEIAVDPDAAPPLAEVARLKARVDPMDAFGEIPTSMHRLPRWAPPRCRPAAGAKTKVTDPGSTGEAMTDPAIDVERELPARPSDAAVQRRFLVQFLMEKRPFEYGNVSRGLFAATTLLAAMRLEEVPGDEEQLVVQDIAFLCQHPATADVIDTRSSVRGAAHHAEAHRILLVRTPLDLGAPARAEAWALEDTIIHG